MTKDIELSGIPSMSVGKVVKTLSDAYCAVIDCGGELKTIPSVMLWGPPGVGKSQAVRQIAAQIGERTGKHTAVTDVRLLLFNPIDLRGIPTANADKTLAVWLKPQIFQMDESEDVVNFLFLDEISAAPQSVQAAAYQITLDRVVGEHRLPDNCIVIAAGNRTTDKSVAYKMPKALANRLLHIEVEINFASWKSWAVKKGLNPLVIGYLCYDRKALMAFDAATEDLAFATPRSWEMVSNLLNAAGSDIDKVFDLVSGLISIPAAMEFRDWCKLCRNLPSLPDIFDGKEVKVPKKSDELYSLVSAMTAFASANRDDMAKIENSLRFAQKLPPDFSVVLMRNYMSIEKDYRQKLMNCPSFTAWLNSKGSLLNGCI